VERFGEIGRDRRERRTFAASMKPVVDRPEARFGCRPVSREHFDMTRRLIGELREPNPRPMPDPSKALAGIVESSDRRVPVRELQ
jgi:hypothetical protein